MEGIEKHLRARRGTEHVLSPRDFSLARSWQAAGIPLATVLVGIDLAFESGDVTSLLYCRRRVEELAGSGARTHTSSRGPVESVPLTEVHDLLSELGSRLERLQPGPAACFEPPLRKIQEVRDLLSVSSRPNWDYLRSKLKEIDDDVSAALLSALKPEELEACRAEAAKAVSRHRGHVDEAALADAMSRYVLQRARERLALPRVGLV